ncbi:DMT family transporter [Mesorhizobium sp. 1B3]|uniref:DMT family transporter n=1 Tax=Mesorhizobium sp. 1B3 TaxID=3243599 RepID=UPI003D983411
MSWLVCLALLNGVLIGASRAINARLGMSLGAFRSSFWNHLGGFLLLAALLFALFDQGWRTASGAPLFAYFGGALGALFVAMNNRVIPRIGNVASLVLVIGGQMIAGLAIDYFGGDLLPTPWQLAGLVLIAGGASLARGRR